MEDDTLVRPVARELFELLGLRVFEAYNGWEALRLLREHDEITVLFTDVRLIGMSGVELPRLDPA